MEEQRVSEIPLVKAANSKSPQQRLEIVVAKLRQLKASKPRTVKTLKSTIASLFQKQLSEGEIIAVLDALHSIGVVAISNEKVTDALPIDG